MSTTCNKITLCRNEKSYYCPSKTYDLAGDRDIVKSNLNARLRMGSLSNMKFTKLFNVRDSSRLGLNRRNYEECAKSSLAPEHISKLGKQEKKSFLKN